MMPLQRTFLVSNSLQLLLFTVWFAFACMKMCACSLPLPTQLAAVWTACVKPELNIPRTLCQLLGLKHDDFGAAVTKTRECNGESNSVV